MAQEQSYPWVVVCAKGRREADWMSRSKEQGCRCSDTPGSSHQMPALRLGPTSQLPRFLTLEGLFHLLPFYFLFCLHFNSPSRNLNSNSSSRSFPVFTLVSLPASSIPSLLHHLLCPCSSACSPSALLNRMQLTPRNTEGEETGRTLLCILQSTITY